VIKVIKNIKIDYLKNFTLFSKMDEEELADVSKLLKKERFSKDHTIFFQEEEGEKVYFLYKGKIKVLKSAPDGGEQILEIIKPGEVFGEVVFFGLTGYPATTRAMEDVEVYVLTKVILGLTSIKILK